MRLQLSEERKLQTILHPSILILVLLLSSVAGRQLFMDGTTFVVQSLRDPFWFPSDQLTPRRMFAVLWTTTPVRLVGLLSPGNVKLASLLFGIATYLQIALPVVVVLRSRLILPVKSLIIVLFLAATLLLANFAVTELLFGLGLTTMFVSFTLQSSHDIRCTKRLILASLLTASYEVVALSNMLLALGTFLLPGPMTSRRMWLIATLTLALPFQILCSYVEPIKSAQNVLNLFVFEMVGIGWLGLLAAILLAKSLAQWRAGPTLMILMALIMPLLVVAAPEHALYLRTREFHYAYPSRFFSAGIAVLIALLPILLNSQLWLWPTRLLNSIGERALANLAVAALTVFYSFGTLASFDAFTYRRRLGLELAQLSGLVFLEECEFCRNPEKFGYPNLGEPSHWPAYSMALSLANSLHPRVIIVDRSHFHEDFGPDQIARFLNEDFHSFMLGP
jgi:hypothetical protein